MLTLGTGNAVPRSEHLSEAIMLHTFLIWLHCTLFGHEDILRTEKRTGALYVECIKCLRSTEGIITGPGF
jgi:hypothetical protein